MKICAFDIGIKHLSACIEEDPVYNDQRELIYKEPSFWKVINILDDAPICVEPMCTLPSKWKNEIGNPYCGRHKNRGKLLQDMDEIHVRNVSEYTPFDIQHRLVSTLDKYPEIYDVDYIFIENQDDNNPLMKSVASSVFTYYMKMAFVSPENPRLKDIRYINARKKTNNVPLIGGSYISQKKTGYDKRKDTSIEYCKRYISKYCNHLLHFFESHRKKDDLADSYMTNKAGRWSLHFDSYTNLTVPNVLDVCETHGISLVKENGKKRTHKQLLKELKEHYIWIP